jgi:hypothetical protein
MGMTPEALKRAEEQFAALASSIGTAASNDPYSQARAEFRGIPRREQPGTIASTAALVAGVAGFREPESVPMGPRLPFIESPTGKIMYENGAIFDPQTGQTLYPPDMQTQVSIQGSNAWLRDVQDRWGEDKVAEWRKRLASQGYDVAEKGGWAVDLVNALKMYHETRYANFGKAIPLTPKGRDGALNIRQTFDKKALKAETKGWGYDVFGEDLDDNEAEFFADRILDVAQRLARKHGNEWSASQIQEGAKLRVQQQFVKDPAVADALDEMEELEGNTAIRDSVISVSQLGAI